MLVRNLDETHPSIRYGTIHLSDGQLPIARGEIRAVNRASRSALPKTSLAPPDASDWWMLALGVSFVIGALVLL